MSDERVEHASYICLARKGESQGLGKNHQWTTGEKGINVVQSCVRDIANDAMRQSRSVIVGTTSSRRWSI